MRYVSKERRGEKIWRGSCYEVVLYQYLGELWIFVHKVSIKFYIKKKKTTNGRNSKLHFVNTEKKKMNSSVTS